MKIHPISPSKLLFTPGPLTTSATVKEAMLRDLGSLDSDFLTSARSIRTQLLDLGPYSPEDYECVLMQGSGTFVVESVISSVVPRDGKLLVLVNGAYGRRIAQIARVHGIALEVLEIAENKKFTPECSDSEARFMRKLSWVNCKASLPKPLIEVCKLEGRIGGVSKQCDDEALISLTWCDQPILVLLLQLGNGFGQGFGWLALLKLFGDGSGLENGTGY
jgi:hypothetical protein